MNALTWAASRVLVLPCNCVDERLDVFLAHHVRIFLCVSHVGDNPGSSWRCIACGTVRVVPDESYLTLLQAIMDDTRNESGIRLAGISSGPSDYCAGSTDRIV